MRNLLIERLSRGQRSLLALRLTTGREDTALDPSVQKGSPSGSANEFPLSLAQEGIWLLDRLAGSEAALNMPAAVRMRGPLVVRILEEAFNEIIRRHDILRTTIHATHAGPRQIVHPIFRVEIRRTDLTWEACEMREASLHRHIGADAQQKFAMDRLPLFGVHVIRTAPEEHVLVVVLHHIIADGWSVGVLIQELNTHYTTLLSGSTWRPNLLPVQYGEFCRRQRQELERQKFASDLAYWRAQLVDPPPRLALTIDKGHRPPRNFHGTTIRSWLPADLTRGITALAAGCRCTVFMALFSVFAIVIRSYTRETRFALGTDVAGRTQSDLERLIGVFTNQVTIMCDVPERTNFMELTTSMSRTLMRAYAHQAIPLEVVLGSYMPTRQVGANPCFQIKCVMPNVPLPNLRFPGVDACFLDVSPATSKFDLTLFIEQIDERLRLSAEFSTIRFESAGIQSMLERFTHVLWTVSKRPDISVSALLNL